MRLVASLALAGFAAAAAAGAPTPAAVILPASGARARVPPVGLALAPGKRPTCPPFVTPTPRELVEAEPNGAGVPRRAGRGARLAPAKPVGQARDHVNRRPERPGHGADRRDVGVGVAIHGGGAAGA